VKPSLKGNKFLGFQILWMSTDQPRFRAPFLHVGDIILQVNGIRMGRPEDYLAAFEALKTAQKVSFDIWRKDERLLIDYPIVEQ
jgi:type II secretory pathway component PulC